MSTSVTSVVSHFPSAENGFSTTTSGEVASGAATVGLSSVAGYTNGEIAVFVIDPTDSTKKQTFTGTIDTAGVQVTGVVWTAGTNQIHATGATVVDYATATHISMISKGILVEHSQDGTHAKALITSRTEASSASGDYLLFSDISDSNNLKKDTIADILTDNATSVGGAWQDWIPVWTNLTIGNGVEVAKYSRIGKRIQCFYRLTLGTTSSVGIDAYLTVPVDFSSNYGTSEYQPIGTILCVDAATAYYMGFMWKRNTGASTATPVVGVASGSYVSSNGLGASVPFTWTTGDVIMLEFSYEVVQEITMTNQTLPERMIKEN